MAMTPAASWTRRIQAQGCKPIVLCTIDTDNVGQHFYFCSGDSPFLMSGTATNGAFAMPNITECTPLEIKLDPISRKASSGEVTVTFVDDGAIRWLNKTYKLYRKRIILQSIEQGDVVGSVLPLFSGYIEELLPGQGKQSVSLRCRDAWGITLSQQVTGQFKKRHPLVAMKVDILDRINVPGSLINATSFDPTASPQPHSHWTVSRCDFMDGQDLSIKQPETAANLLDEIALMMNGSVIPMEDGTLTFVRYDYTKAVAGTYDTSLIRNFEQKSTFENLINKISLKIFWKGTGAGGSAQASGQPDFTKGPITQLGTGDFAIELDHADNDSITAYAYPGVAGSGVSAIPLESKWINNKSVLSDAQTVGYNITSGDTSFYCVGGQIADFCGARTADTFGTLAAGRPAYLLIDNEVIKATSLTFDSLVTQVTGPGETGVPTTSGSGSSTAVGSATQGTNYGTAELARANFSGLTRGMFGTAAAAHFPPAPWQAAHAYALGDFIYVTVGAVVQIWRCVLAGTSAGSASFPQAPTEGQTTYTDNGAGWLYEGLPTGTIVYDITMAIEYLIATIGRFSDGAPIVEFDLPLSEAFLQAGDNIALTEEIGLRYSVDGFVSSDSWEILGKKTTPIGPDACVHITACLARTPPAYTQGWTGPRPINWRSLLDSIHWAGRKGDIHAPAIIGGAIVNQTSGLNCTISNGVNYAGANRTEPGVVQAFACTASKDVYLSWDSILGMYLKRELANGAAAPPFLPHEVPIAKLVTNGSTITASTRLATQEILKGLHLVADQPGTVGYKRTKLVAALPAASGDGLLFVDKTTNVLYRDTGSLLQPINGKSVLNLSAIVSDLVLSSAELYRLFTVKSLSGGTLGRGSWSSDSAALATAGYGAACGGTMGAGIIGQVATTAAGAPNKIGQNFTGNSWYTNGGTTNQVYYQGGAGSQFSFHTAGGSGPTNATEYYSGSAWSVQPTLTTARIASGGIGRGLMLWIAGGDTGAAVLATTERLYTQIFSAGPAMITGLQHCRGSGSIFASLLMGGADHAGTTNAGVSRSDGSSWQQCNGFSVARATGGCAGSSFNAIYTQGCTGTTGTPTYTVSSFGYNGNSTYILPDNINAWGYPQVAGDGNYAFSWGGIIAAGTVFGTGSRWIGQMPAKWYIGAEGTDTEVFDAFFAADDHFAFGEAADMTIIATIGDNHGLTVGEQNEIVLGEKLDVGDCQFAAAAANLGTTRQDGGSLGMRSAAMVIGGIISGVGAKGATTEVWNGATWAAGGSLAAVMGSAGGLGATRAGKRIGGNDNGGTAQLTVEDYNGTAWSSGTAFAVAKGSNPTSVGSKNAAMICNGFSGGAGRLETYYWNGASWAASGAFLTATGSYQGAYGGMAFAAWYAGGAAAQTNAYRYNGANWVVDPNSMLIAIDFCTGTGSVNRCTVFAGVNAAATQLLQRVQQRTYAMPWVTGPAPVTIVKSSFGGGVGSAFVKAGGNSAAGAVTPTVNAEIFTPLLPMPYTGNIGRLIYEI